MKPILYPSTETAFDTNGIGILSDALKCTVTEERNGMFELEMRYPITGVHYHDIKYRSLILAKPNQTDEPQPFRVYRNTKPLKGIVTFYARHISYDLDGIPAQPFAAPNAPAAMQALKTNAVTPCPFDFWTDKQTVATMTNSIPQSIRSLLGGVRGSVLDVYGGEYAFDRYLVRLYNARGMNRGVSIRYGKNLTSLQQDENCAAVYTGVYPFWTGSDGQLVQLPEKIINAPGTYDFVRILTLDLSGEWQEPPTLDQLRARAQRYITENNIGVPKVSLSISFVQLEQYEEYKHLALQERVSLCDTVNVEFPRLGVSATAKVYKTVFDVLRDRWESVELGDARTTLADTIVAQGEKISEAQEQTKTFLQKAVNNATQLITGNKGGNVVLHSTTGDEKPDELLVMDKPSISEALRTWRFNLGGLGYSKNGYNGPYALAITMDGAIVADAITTGTLNAALANIINLNASNINTGTLNANLIDVINLKAQSIISGLLSSVDGMIQFNLDSAEIVMKERNMDGSVPRATMSLEDAKLNLLSGFGGVENVAVRIATGSDWNSGNVRVYKDGQPAVELAGRENGGRIAIGDKNGKVRLSTGINDSTGRFFFYAYNSSGVVIYQIYETDTGNIAVYQKTS